MWSRKCRPTIAALAAGVVLSSCMLVPAVMATEASDGGVDSVAAGAIPAIEQVEEAPSQGGDSWMVLAPESELAAADDAVAECELSTAGDALTATEPDFAEIDAEPTAPGPAETAPVETEQLSLVADPGVSVPVNDGSAADDAVAGGVSTAPGSASDDELTDAGADVPGATAAVPGQGDFSESASDTVDSAGSEVDGGGAAAGDITTGDVTPGSDVGSSGAPMDGEPDNSDQDDGATAGAEDGSQDAPGISLDGAAGDDTGAGPAAGDSVTGDDQSASGPAAPAGEAPGAAQPPSPEGALGWAERDGETYYLGADGEPLTGLVRVDGAWYYLDPAAGGARATGEVELPNGTYHFDEATGAMVEASGPATGEAGWPAAEGADSPSADADKAGTGAEGATAGASAEDAPAGATPNALAGATGTPGWFTDATTNQTFYYDENGQRVTGERAIDGSWYYFDKTTGAMAKGFADITTSGGVSKTVYYDAWGRMLYGELNANSAWYYFDRFNGAMARGITDIVTNGGDAKTVYYATGGSVDGQMQYGERAIDGHWYYFDDFNGAMATGITDIPTSSGGSKTVCYGDDGAMRYGEQAVDGGWYFFDAFDGHMATGWTYLADAPKWVYYGSDGRMRYGEQWIDGDHYWFNTFNGASDYAQVLRWRLNHASGSGSLSLFGGAQASSASITQLAQAMGAFTGQGLNVGFVMMDIATGKGISSNADQSFYSASTVKGPYVASLYDKVFGSSAGGWYQTLSDACVWSDNDAYYRLRSAFGSGAFSDWLYESGVDPNKASTNYTRFTPRELGKLWLRMYDYFGSGAGGNQMSGLFSHGYYSSIYNELGGRYEVRSKPGWYPYDPGYTATNDAGIVYAGGSPYLVVVLSDAPVRLDLVQNLVSALDGVHGSMVG